MSIKIGDYKSSYGTSATNSVSITPSDAYLALEGDDSIKATSWDYIYSGGVSWEVPSISIGGKGNDTYTVNYWSSTIIADGSQDSGDELIVKKYSSSIQNLFTVENRHVAASWYDGDFIIIVDGLTERGGIEYIDFYDLTIQGSNTISELVSKFKTRGNVSWEQSISKGLFNPKVVGINDANEIGQLIDGISEFSTSKTLEFEIGKEYKLAGIRDYDGILHGGQRQKSTRESYKYQGKVDLNDDGVEEAIYTNEESGRWATLGVDWSTNTANYNDNASGGISRIVGIYDDPLVLSGEVEKGSDHDSQTRFQNDLWADNLSLGVAGDFDSDGTQEVYWRTNDGGAYLRSLHHADGNIQYANYQSYDQMSDYLTSTGNSNLISTVVG